MPGDPAAAVERLRERLDESDDIGDPDAEAMRRLSDRIYVLGQAEYSDERHKFHLMRLVKMAEVVSEGDLLARTLRDRDAAEHLVSWVNREYDNPETNKGYRIAIRMFGEHATDGDGKPDSVEWIPTGYPDTYDPSPDPAEMLRWEGDVVRMIDAARNLRDPAIAALAFDLGPRAGELFSLTVGDISDHDYGLQVTLNGKNGRRSPVLVPSVPHVNRWLDVHPAGDDPDAPLWSKLGSADSISDNRVRDVLGALAARSTSRHAGGKRPITPTNFRKSSASHLASEGVSQAHLEAHHGWTRGSKVAARYIAVFGEASDREIARAHGLDVSADESDPTAPIECPRCNRKTPRDEPTCVWCSQAISQSGLETVREQNTAVMDAAASASGDRAEAVVELGALLDEYPFLREAAGAE